MLLIDIKGEEDKRAMSMLRMGKRMVDDEEEKRAMSMLR